MIDLACASHSVSHSELPQARQWSSASAPRGNLTFYSRTAAPTLPSPLLLVPLIDLRLTMPLHSISPGQLAELHCPELEPLQ